MSNTFKLSDIQKKADEEYAAVTIEIDDETTVKLLNVLTLSEDQRKSMGDGPEGEGQLESFQRMLRAVADSAEGAEKIIELVGENLGYYVELFKAYNDRTQVGEA